MKFLVQWHKQKQIQSKPNHLQHYVTAKNGMDEIAKKQFFINAWLLCYYLMLSYR